MNIRRLIKSGIKYFFDRDYRFLFNSSRGKVQKMSDETYLKKLFKIKMGYDLDLINPKRFNEKIQWLKIYDRKDKYTVMVDKYLVKDYVKSIIGQKYIIPTIGVWESIDQINFDDLPNQFVLKCTHNSGGIIFCKNKEQFNIKSAESKLKKHLKQNYFYPGREWPYKNIKPRIIAEKLIVDESEKELKDYKFFCFNGSVKLFKVDFDRFINHRANYYNKECQLLQFGEESYPPDYSKTLKLPNNIKEMIKLAEELSKGHLFLRVDFYDSNETIYFGELTFYPASGFGRFTSDDWDLYLGSLIDLPLTSKSIK